MFIWLSRCNLLLSAVSNLRQNIQQFHHNIALTMVRSNVSKPDSVLIDPIAQL
jgi:hypothetical protein